MDYVNYPYGMDYLKYETKVSICTFCRDTGTLHSNTAQSRKFRDKWGSQMLYFNWIYITTYSHGRKEVLVNSKYL